LIQSLSKPPLGQVYFRPFFENTEKRGQPSLICKNSFDKRGGLWAMARPSWDDCGRF
jgi:hypothetical protein